MYISRIFKQILNDAQKISTRRFSARRALLYVPGDDMRKLSKTVDLDVDCIVMDCEDGVAINKKDAARETIRLILNKGKPAKKRNFDWAVRVNSVDSGLCETDLQAILTTKHLPDTILLPKVERVEHIKWFSDQIKCINSDRTVELIMFIESAMAMINLVEICNVATGLSKTSKFVPCGLVFGSDDFCANIGATRTEDSTEILYARQKMVMIAKAFNLQAIDMVYIQYKDLDGLKRQCEQGARMGYTGKQVIHPGQIPIVQSAFLPSKKQVEWATGLLAAFKEHQMSGKGAFSYNGSMIDMPTMKQAQNVINLITSVNEGN